MVLNYYMYPWGERIHQRTDLVDNLDIQTLVFRSLNNAESFFK